MEKSAIRQMEAWLKSNSLDSGEFKKHWIEAYEYASHLAEQEEKAKPTAPVLLVDGNTSDGYHTFNELYDHRIALYLVICNTFPKKFWKSKKHEDGSCFEGWFLLGGNLGTGDISYHLPISKWNMANCQELPLGKKWDGHTAEDVVERLSRYQPAESLAELAARKGRALVILPPNEKIGYEISVDFKCEDEWLSEEFFIGPTYQYCENKAREYLNGLPDKGEK